MEIRTQITYTYGVLTIFLYSNIVAVGRQIFVLQNQTVILPCTQTSNVTPSWSGPGNVPIYTSGYTINQNLEKIERLSLITNKTLGTFDLQITQFSPEDEGYYMCSSVNYGGIPLKDENISVFIEKPPTNIIIEQSVEGGLIYGFANRPLNITCSVISGVPKERMFWLRGKQVVHIGGPRVLTYTFVPTRNDHASTFTCRAKINVTDVPVEKSIRLFIYYTPVAQILQRPAISVTEGETLTVYCNFSSNHKNTIVNWRRVRRKEFDSSVLNIGSNQHYKIDNVNSSDAGLYICNVASPAGSSEDTVTIEVQYAPDISFQLSKSGLLKCIPRGVPSQYTFRKWEHKTEFNDHIRYIADDGKGQINIPSDLNEGYHHHNRGIYVCSVSNGVTANGNNIQSSEYLLASDGIPYFTTANTAGKYGSYGHDVTINIYVVSFPAMSKISLFKPDFSMNEINYHNFNVTKIKDTVYGKTVFVKGYIIPIQVTIMTDFQSYTVEVTNSIGSSNFTVYFTCDDGNTRGNTRRAAVYIIPILLVGLTILFLAVLYYRFKKGNDIGRQIASFVRRLSLPHCNDEGAIGGVDNDLYELQNNIAPPTNRHDSDDQVYSSIDRRRHLSIEQTVSYSVGKTKKTKPSAQKENENVHRKKRGKSTKSMDTSTNNAASGKDTQQLNYIDICFDQKPKEFRFRINEQENKTSYVEIDFDKSAEMKPQGSDTDSNEDYVSANDVKQMKRKTRLEQSSFDEIHKNTI